MSGSYDRTVRVWDAVSGEELLVLRGHEGAVWRRVFAGWRAHRERVHGTVRVWDETSGAELVDLRLHEWAFSLDRTRIGGSDAIGKDDAALVAHACARLPRDLSPEALKRFNLDPAAPWPCAERAKTLWPHPVQAAIEPATGPAKDAGAAAAR